MESVAPEAWDALVAASRLRSPFLSWTWQAHWAAVFATERRLEIRRVIDGNGELVAVLPLYEAEPGALELTGGAAVSDYLDLLARAGHEEDAWAALLQSRAADRERWVLHAVPAASPTVRAVPVLGRSCSATVTVELEDRCPVLALPESWDAYLASLSGKHRHELLRKMRRLAREAPDARPVCVRDAADVARRLDAFFRAATASLAARGGVGLWFLDGDAGPLASFITLEWNGTVGLYNSGFD